MFAIKWAAGYMAFLLDGVEWRRWGRVEWRRAPSMWGKGSSVKLYRAAMTNGLVSSLQWVKGQVLGLPLTVTGLL